MASTTVNSNLSAIIPENAVRKVYTKTFTAMEWWSFSMRLDLNEIGSEVVYVDGQKLFKNTFSILVSE